MIRVLIAENSAAVRARLAEILRSDPEIDVVGSAVDGAEAISRTMRLRPDLVLMAARMPGLDGFDATRRIMTESPTAIVIASDDLDKREVEASMNALRAGALAVVARPAAGRGLETAEWASELVATIKAMVGVKLVRRWPERPRSASSSARSPLIGRRRVVAIAASTGGPLALQQVLGTLPSDFPLPILIVQHIARGFASGLAAWLNSVSALKVKMAEHGEVLAPKTAYVTPDDRHLGISPPGTIVLSAEPPIGGFRPSASFLFNSTATTFGSSAVAAILTGMGRDGVDGLRAIRQKGGLVIAQDEASSVVFGMPGAAVAAGVADLVLPLDAIASRLVEIAQE